MLNLHFFARDTADVARNLIGCFLVVDGDSYQITETEGYLGEEDEASHARFGKTNRSSVMYGQPGRMYVYLIYGIHHMLNIVTEQNGVPGAVLIRAVKGLDGPGRLTRKLGINKADHNGQLLSKEEGVFIRAREEGFNTDNVNASSRIGIDYASDKWRSAELRFLLEEG